MMFVHGGGFTVGIKDQYAFVGQVFAANGIATAVINYRLSPKTSYPGHVQDVARAFAWLRAHVAEYGGGAERIFVSGHSAGATLVAMRSDPAHLMTSGVDRSLRASSRLWKLHAVVTPGCSTTLMRSKRSRPQRVVNHVAGAHPPFLTLYGDKDARERGRTQ
jgi:hypothetical protein